jgi:hypothetical protein
MIVLIFFLFLESYFEFWSMLASVVPLKFMI